MKKRRRRKPSQDQPSSYRKLNLLGGLHRVGKKKKPGRGQRPGWRDCLPRHHGDGKDEDGGGIILMKTKVQ